MAKTSPLVRILSGALGDLITDRMTPKGALDELMDMKRPPENENKDIPEFKIENPAPPIPVSGKKRLIYKNAVDNIKEFYKAQMEYEKAMDPFDRKGRILDAAIESANMRANMPFITNTMKDLSTFKQRQLLDAEKIKQALPNAQQARLLAADQGFKTQADAIANQQDAATRFAAVGMLPRSISFSA